ncbi:MAG: LuxR C-terminal-related transcriptional regulator [Streptosporangiaceae bacterium]
MPGPLQIIAVSLGPGVGLQRRVLAEVDRLQGRGVLRLLDLLFVAKNEDGTIQRLVADDDDFGALLSRIVPLDGAGLAEPAADDGSPGFDPADARALAESLPPGTALAFLLIEHSWAQPLFDAIAETGGALLSEGFLTSDAGLLVGAEVAAMEQAAQVIAAAQAAEARATLRAMAAESEAAEAVAASETIQAAAAAGAVRALIAAGLVEEAAAHEAVEALNAAGLIAAAADQAAAEAVAEDAAEVRAADQAAARAVAEDAAEVRAADQAAARAVAEDAAEVRAADEVAADAVAEDAATIRAASITLAEARVLRYLSTPLTFALIAGKLGISRSAAKERAERAYKKLGVHSRAEAVIRARALGLID